VTTRDSFRGRGPTPPGGDVGHITLYTVSVGPYKISEWKDKERETTHSRNERSI
jgi:hypothetical protein